MIRNVSEARFRTKRYRNRSDCGDLRLLMHYLRTPEIAAASLGRKRSNAALRFRAPDAETITKMTCDLTAYAVMASETICLSLCSAGSSRYVELSQLAELASDCDCAIPKDVLRVLEASALHKTSGKRAAVQTPICIAVLSPPSGPKRT